MPTATAVTHEPSLLTYACHARRKAIRTASSYCTYDVRENCCSALLWSWLMTNDDPVAFVWPWFRLPWLMPCTMDERRMEAALQYAEYLLSEHRCVTAVEINGSMTQPPSLLAALRYNPNVKSVMVRLALGQADEANVNVLHVVNQLTHLEELGFASVSCNTPSRRDTCLKGPLMGRRMEHLSSLDVSVLTLSTETVRRLAWALIWNRTITELVVPECVFCAYFPSDGYLFSRYLKKKDATLRKLTLKAIGVFKHPGNALSRLVEALCSMTTLEELNMDLCLDHEGFAQKIAPFARVVAQNTTLRSLGLPSSACQGCLYSLATLRDFHFPVVEVGVQAVEPWLAALRHTSSLRKLRIDFRTFDQVAFEAFLEVVAMSDSLRSLVITHLPARTDLLKICLEIRERGLCNRVMIADHHVQSMALHSLTECVHIDRVTVNAGHLAFAVMILSNTQPVFSHFKHVTSLRVRCDLFKERNFADLCAYLSSSSVLTDVEISLCIRRLSMTEAQSRSVPCRLSLALASNTNLCSVVIKGLQLGIGDLAALADAARRSRRLTKFQYTSRTAWDSLVTRRHNVLEDPPFSLDSITCVALAEIQVSYGLLLFVQDILSQKSKA
ncbi:hypothetical protein HPB51_027163 [Rhipicephalus microplus]|uniref:Uncharacterized protein n=1 Tax=Rhipicephalus microplus TaxID=6941 RepID=A0A9J6D189_RHIMP|nr:hypothetical protein HPB51_027163 [Rhipicephalus microplus]